MSVGSSDASTAALKRQLFAQHRKSTKTKGLQKPAALASYVGVFLLVITLVAIGYQPPQKTEVAAANAAQTTPADASATSQPSVDQVIATSVAGDIAERANLPIAPNVAELSVSLSVKSELAQTDDTMISKPQIVQPAAGSRDTKTYVAKAGDTVDGVAAQYGISATTIKWANNLTSDALEPGKQLAIPPVDGIVYTVKAGDTVDSLASKYSADSNRIVAFNDLEISGLSNGARIIIPGGSLPETERPGYIAPRSSYSSSAGSSFGASASRALASAGNRYAPGYCTWYAYERRLQLGRPIGSFWGNATAWASSARAAGFAVNNTPEPGAIMQNGGGYGHVAIVESVDGAGNVTVSEMNYAGYNVVSSRTLSAGQAANYNFIH
ncbi:MAG: domain containing protein [Candidatus Saccharibacteria bacterium]|nr:domain containing protein [Candidatus Saccharibacteria bacterium]